VVQGFEISVSNTVDKSQFVRRYRKQVVRIGRGDLNDLQIENGFVSQFHAVLEAVDGTIVLRDLGSTNGVIVGGIRHSSATVTLGHGVGVFAILSLVISVKIIEVSNIPPPESKRKAMAVTGLLEGPPAGLLEELIQASKEKGQPAEGANLAHLYGAYRKSWNELRVAVQQATMARQPDLRGAFLTKISSDYPAVTQEPDFHNMAAAGGSRYLAMRNPEKESAIALEGLKELSLEYVPQQVPPETPEQIVKFLTRVRGVLDVFFRAFLPLRDGQRQFEHELALRIGAPPTDLVSKAETPLALSNVLLRLEHEVEDPIGIVESIFADVMIHHVAMLNGVMKGVTSILNEISPDAVRTLAEQLVSRGVLSKGFGGNHKVLWAAFEKLHADLVGEEKHLFGLLFGRQFSQAYNEASVVPPGTGGGKRVTVKPGDM
jgi:hypothetical protein